MTVRLLSETGTHKPKVTGSNPVAATADIKASQITKGLANQVLPAQIQSLTNGFNPGIFTPSEA